MLTIGDGAAAEKRGKDVHAFSVKAFLPLALTKESSAAIASRSWFTMVHPLGGHSTDFIYYYYVWQCCHLSPDPGKPPPFFASIMPSRLQTEVSTIQELGGDMGSLTGHPCSVP